MVLIITVFIVVFSFTWDVKLKTAAEADRENKVFQASIANVLADDNKNMMA
jgi:hypothetical protein